MDHWYLDEANHSRLVVEVAAVESRFPSFSLRKDASGDLFWVGPLTTNFDTQYRVKVSYPPNYPYGQPVAFVIKPTMQPSPHRYPGPDGTNGALCLAHPDQGRSHGYDPARTTAATVIGWSAEWLACYEVFLRTGEWTSGKPQH